MKKYALHFNSENRPFQPANIIRWATTEANTKKEAKRKLLGMYFNHQTTSVPPKSFTIDELI